jgi:hypothetical protein
MADETYAPKPPPPDRMVSWPVLIAWRIWDLLSWPWQVHQMKAMGFRRVGWMTWEARPDSELTDDHLAFISSRLGEL